MTQATSPALAFLKATQMAIPRTMGDRDRCDVMRSAMTLAVRSRFKFDRNDGQALKDLAIRTSVGVFRATDYYSLACRVGGTYARMWESHMKQRPWLGRHVILTEHGDTFEVLEENRVAPGLGVLLSASAFKEEEGDSALCAYQGQQVWWCTSQDDDRIVLCRFAVPPENAHGFRGPRGQVQLQRYGHPARIRKLDRQQWQALFPQDIKQAA